MKRVKYVCFLNKLHYLLSRENIFPFFKLYFHIRCEFIFIHGRYVSYVIISKRVTAIHLILVDIKLFYKK